MTVSELAERAGTSADTIRYYERIGLLPDVQRSTAGYRLFGPDDVERVAFVKRTQQFGLSLEEIGELLAIRDRGLCPCGHARDLLTDKLDELDEQIRSLQSLHEEIRTLLDADDGSTARWSCDDGLLQLRPPGRKST